MHQRIFTLVLIILLAVTGQFATEVYLPSMPAMAHYFAVGLNVVQISITVYVLGFSAGSLLHGPLSDKFGRRPIVISCLSIAIIGSFICCLAKNVNWLFVGRFIQGIGLSGTSVVTRSIVKDISTDSATMVKLGGLLGMFTPLAVAVAPIIGGYIQKYAFWRLNFVLLLMVCLSLGILSYLKLPETNKHLRQVLAKQIIKDYQEIVLNKQFLLYNLTSAFALGGVIAYQTMSSYLLQVKVGLSPDIFGYTTLVITMSLISGAILSSKMAIRRGINNMLKLGCSLFVVAGLIYIISGLLNSINVITVLLPIAIFTFGAGILYPNASSGAMNLFTTKAGTAASIYTFFQMLSASLSSGLVSLVNHANQLPLGIIFTCFGISGLKFVALLKRWRKVVF